MLSCVRIVGVTLLLMGLGGCASGEPPKVFVEAGAGPPGAVYRTYAWRSPAAEGNPVAPTDVTRRDWRIRTIVDNLLARKGYARSVTAPDFLVDYDFSEKEKRTESFESYYEYSRAGGAKNPNEAFTFGYSEGTLVLGFLDASTQGLIWRGSATVFADQKDTDTQIGQALQGMLERWPSR